MRARPLILLSCGLIAGFGLGELGVRWFGPPAPAGPPLSAFLQPSEDPVVDFELVPEIVQAFGRGFVHTNAAGRRVLDPQDPNTEGPPGALRVAILGDSTCFGWRLPYERTYVPKLQALIAERLGLELELRNFCVPGYDAAQSAQVLETEVLGWDPQLVIWHYDHNDAHPGSNRRGAASPSRLVELLRRRLQRLDDRGLTPDDEVLQVDDAVQLASGPSYDRHLLALDRVAELLTREQLPHLFVIFDSVLLSSNRDGLHYTRLHAPLLSFLAERELQVLDTFDPYQERMRAAGWDDLSPQYLSLEPLDAHPNQFGHDWMAELVFNALLDAGLLAPPGD